MGPPTATGAATVAAFLSRAYDFVRMAAVSQADLALVGSHAGIAIGADGPSQMALEDIASIRAIHGSTVLAPSDANQCVALTAALVDRPGVTFLRTLRGPTTVFSAVTETTGSRAEAGGHHTMTSGRRGHDAGRVSRRSPKKSTIAALASGPDGSV